MASPPAMDASAWKMFNGVAWGKKATCPSVNKKLAPPVCWLPKGLSFSLSGKSGMIELIGNLVFRRSRP